MSRLNEGGRKRRTAYTSGRLELVGFESGKKSLRVDGKKTSRKVSKEAARKMENDPISRTDGKFKSWKRW